MLQHDGHPRPVTVIQFKNDRGLAGIRKLGIDGGVDLDALIQPPNPEIEGEYHRVPNVSGLLQIYSTRYVPY